MLFKHSVILEVSLFDIFIQIPRFHILRFQWRDIWISSLDKWLGYPRTDRILWTVWMSFFIYYISFECGYCHIKFFTTTVDWYRSPWRSFSFLNTTLRHLHNSFGIFQYYILHPFNLPNFFVISFMIMLKNKGFKEDTIVYSFWVCGFPIHSGLGFVIVFDGIYYIISDLSIVEGVHFVSQLHSIASSL